MIQELTGLILEASVPLWAPGIPSSDFACSPMTNHLRHTPPLWGLLFCEVMECDISLEEFFIPGIFGGQAVDPILAF